MSQRNRRTSYRSRETARALSTSAAPSFPHAGWTALLAALAAVALTVALSARDAHAKGVPSSDPEIEKAQVDLARAYATFQSKLDSGTPVSAADRAAIFSSASSGLNKVIGDREQKFEKSVTGVTFHKNGTITPGGPKDNSAKGATLAKGDAKSAARTGVALVNAADRGKTKGGAEGRGLKRNEYELDGKDVPAELDFSHRRRPASVDSEAQVTGASAPGTLNPARSY